MTKPKAAKPAAETETADTPANIMGTANEEVPTGEIEETDETDETDETPPEPKPKKAAKPKSESVDFAKLGDVVSNAVKSGLSDIQKTLTPKKEKEPKAETKKTGGAFDHLFN